MDEIPILKIRDCLLVSIQVDMHDRLALALQDDLTNRIVENRARGVMIDISALEIVDSFIGRMLNNIAGNVARARRGHGRRRDATCGGDYARRARRDLDWRPDSAQRRTVSAWIWKINNTGWHSGIKIIKSVFLAHGCYRQAAEMSDR
jgi:hypothetical protein